ncbi:SDR family NAD(P)-dependent oxidoreductase [Burkholderia sp. Bp8998]|uniref:SDR family NAD(P)-dependent oxidoreductase n=1 Tax=Burkholderia sp. Bp8998 TaxID=2184557 RepID=UPI000F5B587C|nr:SDR family NAD(P)-dependent oxidoreductase [Burkholderia sp. Bp8998]RQS05181.1 SDR family NAD(P)-dependent oxidoreductase [Burkholderia sp. Bp8998]
MTKYHGTTVVTGGASGIGLATTCWLLARGRPVLVLDRSKTCIDAAKDALEEYAADVTFVELDVTDETRMCEVIVKHDLMKSPLVGLVNCAGYGQDTPFLETTSKALRDMLEVNLVGTFSISREVAKRMMLNGGGGIVHIASVSGLIGNKGRSAYGATKAAIVNLTQVMANELARHKIRVNCVCPGPIETPLASSVHTARVKEVWRTVVPMQRYGTPMEVAGAIGFLLDNEASAFVTGQIISVDGGFISSGLLPE